jgi:hypothetical protein
MIRQSSFLSAGFFLFIFVFFWPFSINGGNAKIVQKGNLPPPSIQTPVEGAQYGGKTLEFKWARVEGASRYRLQVAEDTILFPSRMTGMI